MNLFDSWILCKISVIKNKQNRKETLEALTSALLPCERKDFFSMELRENFPISLLNYRPALPLLKPFHLLPFLLTLYLAQ